MTAAPVKFKRGDRPRCVSLLGRTWGLHDVEDVEKFVSKVLDDALRARSAHLRPHEYEDALSYLLSEAWTLSEHWEPSRSSVTFAGFAYRVLRLRVVDWYRAELGRTKWQFSGGRTHDRERPAVLSLDAVSVRNTSSGQHHGGHRAGAAVNRPVLFGGHHTSRDKEAL
jgi:hypothetical protein